MSPKAGWSLAIIGAAALADAFAKHGGEFPAAFEDYDETFRPCVEDVQARAAANLDMLIPQTEEAIRLRNSSPSRW